MYRSRTAPAAANNTLDDLVTRSVVAGLHASGPNLALQATQLAASQDLVPNLVRKVLLLETENTKLQEQLGQHQRAGVLGSQEQQSCGCRNGCTQNHLQQQQQQHPIISQQESLGCQQQQQLYHLQQELQRLQQECKAAWKQVADMKHFLNDYGLVWVGETGTGHKHVDAQQIEEHAPTISAAGSSLLREDMLPFDLEELQQCVNELNQVAGDGIAKFQHVGSSSNSGAAAAGASSIAQALQLCTPEPVKLFVYQDGLQLHTAPAALYTSATADSILADIFDGYFPSVLKCEFPDGTPLQLLDKTSTTVARAATAVATASNIKGFLDLQPEHQQGVAPSPMTGEMFVSRLPKTVIRNYQVVPVRSAVADYINSSSSGAAGYARVYIRATSTSSSSSSYSCRSGNSTSEAAAAQTQAVGESSAAAAGSGVVEAQPEMQQQQQCTTIQIKSEDGWQTYVLKLPFTATIAALRSGIDTFRASSGFTCSVCLLRARALQQPVAAAGASSGHAAAGGCAYELRSSFPARVYSNPGLTLQEVGLTPSATLFMRHS